MTRDKQLHGVSLRVVRLKRDLDQALNAKEFAVLAGISYSLAREWFHLPGFPAVGGMVFWCDFVLWRRSQNLPKPSRSSASPGNGNDQNEYRSPSLKTAHQWPARAAGILAEAQ
jgi:hypothetical protein